MSLLHRRPRYAFGEAQGLYDGWQASFGSRRLGPVRMFQWEALADLPDEAFGPTPSDGRHYELYDPYRVSPTRGGLMT